MKLLSVFIGGIAASPAIFDDSRVANAILKRSRRNNNGLFEEARAADIVRECHEEICSFDEVMEYYEDEDQANAFWNSATKMCSEDNACHRPGTATCVNMWRKRRCECRDGYTNTAEADDCSTDIDECAVEGFCANGGVCTNSVGSFNCDCPAGWGGARCDEDIDECAADTPACQNGGACTNTEGGFTCECTAQWTGDFCEIDVDECAVAAEAGENLCLHDGKCMNTQGDFECLCTMGWAGKTCDADFDECSAALCPAGTVCKIGATAGELPQTFTCECPERGCNNLDEALYQQKLSSTYGFEDVSLGDGSGDVEEVAEEVVEEEFVEEVAAEGTTEGNSYDYNDVTDEMMIEDNDINDQYVSIDDNTTESNSEYYE